MLAYRFLVSGFGNPCEGGLKAFGASLTCGSWIVRWQGQLRLIWAVSYVGVSLTTILEVERTMYSENESGYGASHHLARRRTDVNFLGSGVILMYD